MHVKYPNPITEIKKHFSGQNPTYDEIQLILFFSNHLGNNELKDLKEEKDFEGKNLLYHAVGHNCTALSKRMIGLGYDVNSRANNDPDKPSPVLWCLHHKNMEVTSELIKNGAKLLPFPGLFILQSLSPKQLAFLMSHGMTGNVMANDFQTFDCYALSSNDPAFIANWERAKELYVPYAISQTCTQGYLEGTLPIQQLPTDMQKNVSKTIAEGIQSNKLEKTNDVQTFSERYSNATTRQSIAKRLKTGTEDKPKNALSRQ